MNFLSVIRGMKTPLALRLSSKVFVCTRRLLGIYLMILMAECANMMRTAMKYFILKEGKRVGRKNM